MTSLGAFPRITEYLSLLPQGAGSYPECQSRGSTSRSHLATKGTGLLAQSLPPNTARWVREPPLNSGWIPTVDFVCINLAIADHHGMSDAAYSQWIYRDNKEMFGNVIFRLLMSFASPALLLEQAEGRWAKFHRGVSFKVEPAPRNGARAVSTFPPNLFPKIVREGFGMAIKAALELSNARSVKVQLLEAEPGRSVYEATWL
jgi:hypothetical protein